MDFYDYFGADRTGFWQWEEQGEVLAVRDGGTIAYREWMLGLIDTMADQGIPPFGALLLTLVATNPDATTTLNTELAWFRLHPNAEEPVWANAMSGAFTFLNELAAVPPDYQTGQKRILLLQTIFADSHNRVGQIKARKLVNQLRNNRYDLAKLLEPKPMSFARQFADLQTLSLLNRQFPTVDYILKKMADLPDLPVPFLPDDTDALPAPGPPTTFVDALLAAPKTFEVGALVRRLWSGLAVPFRQALPEQQPTGGVSDLTNRGEVSRLLVSELAYDDLTFISRLANNEALYLNRDIPPATDSRDRIVLIDVSLKTWGTPRIIAFAIAVALDQHPKATARCRIFAVGANCMPLAISTIDTIIDGLQRLAGCLHPADGLADFFQHHAPKTPAEVFFISTPATVRLAVMQQALSHHQTGISYHLLTDSAGTISLYRQQRNGRKHLQDLTLPLAELWKPRPGTPKKLTQPADNQPPPAIPRPTFTYPILFPTHGKKARFMQADDGSVFQITDKKCLLQFDGKRGQDSQMKNFTQKGLRLIYDKLPFTADECEIGYIPGEKKWDAGDHMLLLFRRATRELYLLNLTTFAEQRAHMPDWKVSPYPHFFFVNAPPPLHKDLFQYMTTTQYWTVDPTQELTIIGIGEKPDDWLIDSYRDRERIQKELAGWNLSRPNILKNVHAVFINEAGNLVMNNHELRQSAPYPGYEQIELSVNKQLPMNIGQAVSTVDKQEFTFADGSFVFINRAGMLVLVSSNRTLPPIYVPMVLDSPLGAATDVAFTGNAYYRPTNSTQTAYAMPDFWQAFLVPFIDTIVRHGNHA